MRYAADSASFGKRHDFPAAEGSFESRISCRDYASAAEKRLDGRLAEAAAQVTSWKLTALCAEARDPCRTAGA